MKQKQSTLKLARTRTLVVAIGFCAFMGVSLAAALFLGRTPSPQMACTEKCATLSKQGNLRYSGPATPKSMYKEAQSECQCQ